MTDTQQNITIIRPESHEIDTMARRRVPNAMPANWEHREITGRDYGIDMLVEVFDKGMATGINLLLQIKGTKQDIDENQPYLYFDVPVKTLKYSEFFTVPVLLVLCPVDKGEHYFYYLWLQEYIKVVLDFENKTWRQNTTTARVHIPITNKIPGNEGHLAFVGNYPRRIHDWAQVGRLQHMLRSSVCWTNCVDLLTENNVKEALSFYKEALSLEGIFGDPNWYWGKMVKEKTIDPAIKACELFLRGEPFTKEEIESLGSKYFIEDPNQENLKFSLGSTIMIMADRLSLYLAIGNDFKHKQLIWKEQGEHDF